MTEEYTIRGLIKALLEFDLNKVVTIYDKERDTYLNVKSISESITKNRVTLEVEA